MAIGFIFNYLNFEIMPIPALVAGLGVGLGYAGASMLSSNYANSQTSRYSKALMRYQNELNLQNWRLQNEYNLPINEKNRWLQAGINPMFGIGSNLAGSVPNPSAQMQAQAPDFSGAVSMGMQAAQMHAQTENIEEDTRGKRIQNDINEQYGALGADANIRETLQRVNNLIKDGKYTEAKTLTENVLRMPQYREINSRTDKNVADTAKTEEETKYIGPYYKLQERSVGVSEKQQIAEENHYIRMDEFGKALADAQIGHLDYENKKLAIETAMQRFLYQSGLFAKNYQAQIDNLASLTALNYDQIKHLGISPTDVVGNLLNAFVGGDADNFYTKLLGYWSNPDVEHSFIGFIKYWFNIGKGKGEQGKGKGEQGKGKGEVKGKRSSFWDSPLGQAIEFGSKAGSALLIGH